MLTAKEFVIRRIRANIIFPVILMFFLTIGNYSFFRYSIQGVEHVPAYLKLVPYVRLLIPAWIIGYCLWMNLQLTTSILKDHFDIVLLGLSWTISGILSLDIASYLFYGIWTWASLLSVLLYLSYAAVVSGTKTTFLFSTLHVIWIGNFVILILVAATMLWLKPRGGMYQLIYSSNTFWAYPTMIMGMLALIKMRFTTKGLTSKIYFLGIFLLCVMAVYFSARRSPLFALLLTAALSFVPPKIPYILLISFLMVFFLVLFNSVAGEKIIKSLPDSYMKYRIERMSGMIKGRKETSYVERQKIWKVYLDSFYQKPVFGEGLAADQRITGHLKGRTEGVSAHNTFIGILAETGLSGALLMLTVLGRSLRLLLKSADSNWKKTYMILFLPTVLINWVEYNLIPGQIFFLYTMIVWLLPRGLCYVPR